MTAGQLVGQFRLAGKDDLQQLGSRSFEVGEQANGFEHGRIEVLRFVDDDDETASSARLLQQHLVELLVHAHEILVVALYAQFGQKEAHKLARAALCLKKECGT